MKPYTYFARVYDSFMNDIPYTAWADAIEGYIKNKGIADGASILELGCGTGRFTRLLAADGYDMTGIDLSSGMIRKARRNSYNFPVKYITGDMRNTEPGRDYDVVLSVCDSMNYLTDTEGLYDTFLNVRRHLKRGGFFIFDMKTEAFYEKLSDNIYTDEAGNVKYFWENSYDCETRNNTYYLSFYVKKLWLYRRYAEEHIQHAFTQHEVQEMAEKAELTPVDILGGDMKSPADITSDRIYYILSRK